MEGVNCGENHISSENMPLSRAKPGNPASYSYTEYNNTYKIQKEIITEHTVTINKYGNTNY